MLMCFPCLGFFGCGEGQAANYFKTIKEPDNYRIEYKYGESKYIEIRVKNNVAFKTNNPDVTNHHSISKNTEWTIYKNKYKQNTYIGSLSKLAKSTYLLRQDVANLKLEGSETTFLGREALSYTKKYADSEIEFILDKKYDIHMASYITIYKDGIKKTGFEVTLFEIGGQQLPDNPELIY